MTLDVDDPMIRGIKEAIAEMREQIEKTYTSKEWAAVRAKRAKRAEKMLDYKAQKKHEYYMRKRYGKN